MKIKLATLILIGLVTSCGLTFAQPATEDTPASTESSNDVAAAAEADTNSVGAAPAESTTAAEPAATNATEEGAAPADAIPASAATDIVSATEESESAKHDEIIPLIQFQDVQLTTAIENLARQAGINYILDPKVGFGQPDERGQVRPQPSISIRWENVSAGQALQALLQNNGLQLVVDPKSPIARVTVKDPAAPDPLVLKVVQLKYAGPSNMVAAVQATLTDKRSKVIGDVRTSQLVVVATEKEQDAVQNLVNRLDTATKQVLIEAKLLETSQNPSTIKGIDWSGTLAAQSISFGNGNISGTTTTADPGTPSTSPSGAPLSSGRSQSTETTTTFGPGIGGLAYSTASGLTPATAFLNADGLNAVLSFLNTHADAKVLSTPRTVTLDNEPASLSVTRATPIINVTAGTANTTGGSQITYTNLGVILNVTPRITANNYVNLKVIPEVSRVFDTVSKVIGSTGTGGNAVFQADEYDIRRIETTVVIPSGNTLVLGGLVQDDIRTSNTKVPLLGDIPVLGYAFRKDQKSRQKQNLLIFITPTIVQESDFQPTKTDFLKIVPKDFNEADWSAWDSGKPYDWSKRGKNKEEPVFDEDAVKPAESK